MFVGCRRGKAEDADNGKSTEGKSGCHASCAAGRVWLHHVALFVSRFLKGACPMHDRDDVCNGTELRGRSTMVRPRSILSSAKSLRIQEGGRRVTPFARNLDLMVHTAH